MKLLPYLTATLLLMAACNNAETTPDETTTNEQETDVSTPEVVEENEAFLSVTKWDTLKYEDTDEYYIISYAGTETEENAIAMIDSLQASFPNAGYLWIPDFKSLSGKELYAIFLDQSKYEWEIMESLQKLKSDNEGIYLVRLNQSEERWVAYSPIDIRINGEKQKMILTYATPEDEEAYFAEGGEDWGWFVHDVTTYFNDNHPEILFESVFYSGLLPAEIEKLEEKVQPEGFCYIFIDGSEYGITGHDLPDGVIYNACEFFGFEAPEYGY